MSYYLQYLEYVIGDDTDRSYHSPEEQLLWRLDDLIDRQHELLKKCAPYGGCRCSYDELRFASPGYFSTVYAVEAAIDCAKEELRNTYGIPIDEETDTVEVIAVPQLTFAEIICMQEQARYSVA